MKKREINALLKRITTRGKLDVNKIPELTDDERQRMVYEIVKRRLPIVKELIPAGFDYSWLHSCGYLYTNKGSEYTFICNGEHHIK